MLVLSPSLMTVHALKGEDRKAKKQIIRSLSRAVENKWSNYDLVLGSIKNDSSNFAVYNKTNASQILPLPPQPPIICIRAPCPGENETIPIPPINETSPPITNETGNETIPPIILPPAQDGCPDGFYLDKDNICVPSTVIPPPIVCPAGQHEENGVCVPNPQPPTGGNVTTNGTKTTVCFAGDLTGSAVPNAMKNCNFKVGVGDLGYKSDLSYFKSLKWNQCVIGNHDSLEDGSSSIQKEALAYCGDHWFKILASDTTIIIGLNTNGDEKTQIDFVKSIPVNNYKNVIIVSHKNGETFPNAHHPAEAKSLYAAIEQIPFEGKLYEVSGHNHNMASTADGTKYISGEGGRSHYNCGTSQTWTFCDSSHNGFLEFEIDNANGNIKANFIDTNNKVVH